METVFDRIVDMPSENQTHVDKVLITEIIFYACSLGIKRDKCKHPFVSQILHSKQSVNK